MQHPQLTPGRLCILLICLVLPAVSTRAADGCARFWTPAELAKKSKRLDRQIICVRALLRPLPKEDRSSMSLFVYEAVPLDAKLRQLDANRIGLVDWDKELGIDESLNRPESEDLLERAANRCPGIPKDELSFDAEFRAVVEYRRDLTERAYAVLPPNLSTEKPRRTHYDTELVFLEMLKVTALCRR
jgi:hypothetical protein